MKRLLAAIGLPIALITAPVAQADDFSCELYGGILFIVAVNSPVTLCSSGNPTANPPGVSVVPATPKPTAPTVTTTSGIPTVAIPQVPAS